MVSALSCALGLSAHLIRLLGLIESCRSELVMLCAVLRCAISEPSRQTAVVNHCLLRGLPL